MSVLDDLEEMTGALGGTGSALSDLGPIIEGVTRGTREFGAVVGTTADGLKIGQDGLARTSDKLRDAQGRFASTGESAQGFTDKLQSLGGSGGALDSVTNSLKALGPEGEAAAEVLKVLATVITYAAETLWGWVTAAIAAAQTRDALVATFDAVTGAGNETLAQIDKLAASLPYTTAQVREWAKSMAMVGKTGEGLDLAVQAIAASAAITRTSGEAATALIRRWAEMAETGQRVKLDRRQLEALAKSGVDLAEFARQLGTTKDKLGSMTHEADKLGDAFQRALVAKGGPALENVGLTWDSIKAKMSEGFGSIFAGMSDAVKPLMKEIQSLFAEFNKGSTTIAPVKSLMTSFLTTVFEYAARVVNMVHVGFLTMEIMALRAYIALAPIVRALRAILTNSNALLGMKVIFGILLVPLGLLVSLVVGLGAAFVIATGLIGTAIGFVVGAVSTAVGYIGSLIVRAVNALAALGTAGKTAASNFIAGIIGGITSGVGAAVEAVKGLASSMASSFTGFFQIKSPSRLMKEHGKQLPAGAAEGIDDGADEAQRSMEEMLEPPKAKPRARAQASASKSTPAINFNNCVFFPGADEGKIRALLMKVWQQEMGAGPEPATT